MELIHTDFLIEQKHFPHSSVRNLRSTNCENKHGSRGTNIECISCRARAIIQDSNLLFQDN